MNFVARVVGLTAFRKGAARARFGPGASLNAV